MVTFNGTNVLHVDTYVRNHSGETIEVMVLVLPTNLVLYEVAITMEISG